MAERTARPEISHALLWLKKTRYAHEPTYFQIFIDDESWEL